MIDASGTAYYIHGLEVMKLIFSVQLSQCAMGLTRCYERVVYYILFNINVATEICN